MRILAIRGRNLASLAANFELDLANAPLGRAGLFAISGKTGAGKSTLLDALCLALFDRVPRLSQAGKVAVGQADLAPELRISGDDARSILRRGAAEGYAEVEFTGVDRKAYRARWEVRRARNRPDGKLQEQVLSLSTLPDGTLIGRTKKEVLAEISQRLGLSFDQFRRAALLAQGDFAAFLKAAHKERSELLERITGTEIYSELSRAAYHRAREEDQKLREQETRLEFMALLSESERGALAAERGLLAETRRKAEAELAGMQDCLRWHAQAQALQQDCDMAGQGLLTADAAWQAATGRVDGLARVRAAQPLRALLIACDRASQASREAETASQAAQLQASLAQEVLSGQERTFELAMSRYQAAEAVWRQVQPELQAAQALDVRIEEMGHQLAIADAQHSKAGLQAARTADAANALRARQACHETELDADRAWLNGQAHLDALAAQWPRWEESLGWASRVFAKLQSARNALPRLRSQLQAFQAGILLEERVLEDALAAEERATLALSACENNAVQWSLAALNAQRGCEELRRDRLQTALALLAKVEECGQRLSRLRGTLDQLSADAGTADAALATLQPRRTPLEARLAEAEAAYERTLLAAHEDVAQLRGQLRPGEPCMVCGADEHPWAQQHPAFDALLQDQRTRVQVLKGELHTHIETESRWLGKLTHTRADLCGCQQQIKGLELELELLLKKWQQLPEGANEPDPVRDQTLADRLQRQLAEVTAALEALQVQEQAALASDAAVKAARGQCDKLRQKREALQMEVQARRGREQMLLRALEAEAATASAAEAEHAQACEQLAAPLSGVPHWRTRLDAEGQDFLVICRQWVLAYQQREQQARRHDAALRDIAPALAEAESELRTAEAQASMTLQDMLACRTRLVDLQAKRQEYFAGEPAEIVSRRLRDSGDQARMAQEAARLAFDAAREKGALSAQISAHQLAQLDTCQRQLAAAQAELAAALDRQGWEEPELRHWLDHDAEWLACESAALESLQDTCRETRIRLAERRTQLARHGADRPTLSEEEARMREEILRNHLQLVMTELAGVELRLRHDDQQREQAAALRHAVDQQRARWALWDELRELIGSADGAKFRNFAQSLTLDALLGQANLHLEDLARRYRLERVPGSDLDIQVIDLDMADEVRSVHSLSGGESFLVSLALALGLASLSSQSTLVESLFIDEGFGALDPDTLGIAIGSLDALQSQGRQIGVISHVPALVESIGIQVRVEAQGGGRSRVRVVDAQLAWPGMADGVDAGGEGDAADLSRQSAGNAA